MGSICNISKDNIVDIQKISTQNIKQIIFNNNSKIEHSGVNLRKTPIIAIIKSNIKDKTSDIIIPPDELNIVKNTNDSLAKVDCLVLSKNDNKFEYVRNFSSKNKMPFILDSPLSEKTDEIRSKRSRKSSTPIDLNINTFMNLNSQIQKRKNSRKSKFFVSFK